MDWRRFLASFTVLMSFFKSIRVFEHGPTISPTAVALACPWQAVGEISSRRDT